jgi:sortase (surface protein transpeptidase)
VRVADARPAAGGAATPVVALLLAGVLLADGLLLVTRSRAAETGPSPTASAAPRAPAEPSLPAPPAPPAAGPLRLTVPALGVDAEALVLGTAADGTLEVPGSAQGVGWYAGSAVPGDVGPAVFAGHVDLDGQPGVFSALGALDPGQEVLVQRPDGETVRFVVSRVEQHAKDAFPTAGVYGPTDTAELRLVTCGGAFDRRRGSYRDNVVVFARRG